MRIKILIFSLVALTGRISADIFDVFPSFKAYRNLPSDMQTVLAQQIIQGEIVTGFDVKNRIKNASDIYSIAWSPDGKYFSAGSDKTIKIWDTSTWHTIKTMRGHNDIITHLAWNPNGRYLASGSLDDTIKIWDTTRWHNIQTLTSNAGQTTSLIWSPNNNYLASGFYDGTIMLWDSTTWHRAQILAGHINEITALAWSPNGNYLASSSSDKTIKIWDTTTWHIIKTLAGYTDSITSLEWSPDSANLAAGLGWRTFIIWSFPHPIIQEQEWQNISLEQALFLILLNTKRPTFAHAKRKPLCVTNLHPKLTKDEALALLHSFDKKTQAKINARYNICISIDPTLTPHEHQIFWGW